MSVAEPGRPGRVSDKVCIVTGGGSRTDGIGNGRASAILYAREGAKVLVQGRTREGPERTCEMIAAEGGVAAPFVGDVTEPEAAEAMAALAAELWGGIDVLHNNIGVGASGTVVDVGLEEWDRTMTVNVRTVMICSKYSIPVMARGGGGSIITSSSLGALRPRGQTPYSVSKGAVITLTRAMAVDHGASGIRVNCLAIGAVYTPMATRKGMSDDLRERRRLSSLLEVEGTAWDTANAAVFLASDEARYITGAVLPVDGGASLRGPSR